jgi:F-type H+-transporting ATPase subunit epsilon
MSMPDKILLEIISPEKVVLTKEVKSLQVPGTTGYMGILPGHAPLVTGIQAGVVTYMADEKEEKLAVSGGFMEVYKNKATILADSAELASEIDIDRAKRAMERAEERIHTKQGVDLLRAEAALSRAVARIKTLG